MSRSPIRLITALAGLPLVFAACSGPSILSPGAAAPPAYARQAEVGRAVGAPPGSGPTVTGLIVDDCESAAAAVSDAEGVVSALEAEQSAAAAVGDWRLVSALEGRLDAARAHVGALTESWIRCTTRPGPPRQPW
jgi:hypothetical protein